MDSIYSHLLEDHYSGLKCTLCYFIFKKKKKMLAPARISHHFRTKHPDFVHPDGETVRIELPVPVQLAKTNNLWPKREPIPIVCRYTNELQYISEFSEVLKRCHEDLRIERHGAPFSGKICKIEWAPFRCNVCSKKVMRVAEFTSHIVKCQKGEDELFEKYGLIDKNIASILEKAMQHRDERSFIHKNVENNSEFCVLIPVTSEIASYVWMGLNIYTNKIPIDQRYVASQTITVRVPDAVIHAHCRDKYVTKDLALALGFDVSRCLPSQDEMLERLKSSCSAERYRIRVEQELLGVRHVSAATRQLNSDLTDKMLIPSSAKRRSGENTLARTSNGQSRVLSANRSRDVPSTSQAPPVLDEAKQALIKNELRKLATSLTENVTEVRGSRRRDSKVFNRPFIARRPSAPKKITPISNGVTTHENNLIEKKQIEKKVEKSPEKESESSSSLKSLETPKPKFVRTLRDLQIAMTTDAISPKAPVRRNVPDYLEKPTFVPPVKRKYTKRENGESSSTRSPESGQLGLKSGKPIGSEGVEESKTNGKLLNGENTHKQQPAAKKSVRQMKRRMIESIALARNVRLEKIKRNRSSFQGRELRNLESDLSPTLVVPTSMQREVRPPKPAESVVQLDGLPRTRRSNEDANKEA
ncbi:unnamed protein product [Caenorhabditis bovis]|uniref:Uncharacterized protein n=1 Tax=Caenorhabditis bovis TaxID=2654633 RepID=A0A8S1F198_9PELO|nr:unnamed protein product [Caenorhabditis bovis]